MISLIQWAKEKTDSIRFSGLDFVVQLVVNHAALGNATLSGDHAHDLRKADNLFGIPLAKSDQGPIVSQTPRQEVGDGGDSVCRVG